MPLACCGSGPSPDARRHRQSDSRTAIKASRLKDAARGHGLYLVGGSFRALALLDMKTTGHPLPIIHHHRIMPERLPDLRRDAGKHGASMS